MPNYLPLDQRTPDSQYQDLLGRIASYGEVAAENNQGVPAMTLFQQKMQFPFSNGFPVITERSVGSFWNKGIGELCAFINGVTKADELAEFGADWWGAWTTPEKAEQFDLPVGDIGPASYGGAFHDFPTLDGDRFDQYANLVRQIKEMPTQRIHTITSWMPAENARGTGTHQRNTIAPCHGDVRVEVLNGRLHLHMFQRSCDTPVGGPSNIIQYAALVLMLEHLTGYEAACYYHTIWNAHFYANQSFNVLQMLQREPRCFPTVHLTEEGRKVTDIHDFRREHFSLEDYHPHPAINGIPVLT